MVNFPFKSQLWCPWVLEWMRGYIYMHWRIWYILFFLSSGSRDSVRWLRQRERPNAPPNPIVYCLGIQRCRRRLGQHHCNRCCGEIRNCGISIRLSDASKRHSLAIAMPYDCISKSGIVATITPIKERSEKDEREDGYCIGAQSDWNCMEEFTDGMRFYSYAGILLKGLSRQLSIII